jgi:hypothetical protein
MHVHVRSADGEAKFWMEPKVELVQNYGLRQADLRTAQELIEEHKDEIKSAWQKHFPG